MENSQFSELLINWYQKNKRDLPWRYSDNPYFIWLSEVILQQTRVAQGLPYYQKFIEHYPSVTDLACADEQEVLRLWQGLGYYSRARNMHRTAQIIVDEWGGEFPNTYQNLIKLKGIGPYTAAAIASFAFREPVAVVDGNVFRVLARIFGIETDIASHEAKKLFQSLADKLLDNDKPHLFNQAIMEFGAIFCTPLKPSCLYCQFSEVCVANKEGKQSFFPVKNKKIKVQKRYFNYFVVESEGGLWMRQRDVRDIWGGLFDFYLYESEHLIENPDEITDDTLDMMVAKAKIEGVSNTMKHILTHQRIEAKFWHLIYSSDDFLISRGMIKYSWEEIEKLPKPILIVNYLKKYFPNFQLRK